MNRLYAFTKPHYRRNSRLRRLWYLGDILELSPMDTEGWTYVLNYNIFIHNSMVPLKVQLNFQHCVSWRWLWFCRSLSIPSLWIGSQCKCCSFQSMTTFSTCSNQTESLAVLQMCVLQYGHPFPMFSFEVLNSSSKGKITWWWGASSGLSLPCFEALGSY